MQRTFLVTLELSDTSPASLAGVSEDINEACLEDGLSVVSVKPWSEPKPSTVSGFSESVQVAGGGLF